MVPGKPPAKFCPVPTSVNAKKGWISQFTMSLSPAGNTLLQVLLKYAASEQFYDSHFIP
jgi:hypothetical protein